MSKKDINSSIFAALKVSEKSKVPFLLIGNPGTGKTTTVEMFSKIRGYEMILLRGSQSTPEEILGYDVSEPSISKSTTVKLRPAWFEKLLNNTKSGKKCLLFLDEITTANEYTQSALLHLIFERKVGDEDLPEDTLIVSAGNYASNLSSQFNLIPPLMNRFCIYNIVATETDLDNFLSEYKGASVNGKPNGIEKSMKDLKEMDDLEPSISDEFVLKVSEKIEFSINLTSKSLIRGSKLDLKVTDMQDLYGDLDNDAALPGFVTLRSLVYLKRLAIASYRCFGKSGLTSDNFRNMVIGTCGIALSRSKSDGSVIKTDVTDSYCDSMRKVGDDIDRMMTSSLPKYEDAIKRVIKEIGTTNVDLSIEDMNSLMTVIDNVENDKSASKIECPIDPQIITRLGDCISLTSKKSTSEEIDRDKLEKLPADVINGHINKFNMTCRLYQKLYKFITNKSRNYNQDVVTHVGSTVKKVLNKTEFKLSTQASCAKKNLPASVVLNIDKIN